MDAELDIALSLSRAPAKIQRLSQMAPSRHVLLVGVEMPGREGLIGSVMQALASKSHIVTSSTVAMGDRGKFENAEAAISQAEGRLSGYDWLLIVDDDIAVRPGFLDAFIGVTEAAGFSIAQPAHLFHSFASHIVTQRKAGSIARQTQLVESGPLVAFHRRTFEHILPFPQSRWGWGVDLVWSDLARQHGWTIGIVDATPIEHLQPVAAGYDRQAARAEYRQLLASRRLAPSLEQFTAADTIVIDWS